jgi:hypothetical protein
MEGGSLPNEVEAAPPKGSVGPAATSPVQVCYLASFRNQDGELL